MKQALVLCALLMGCTGGLTALRPGHDAVMDELRMEIADLKHALHGTEVDVKLLGERIEQSAADELHAVRSQLVTLEKKMEALKGGIDTSLRSQIHSWMEETHQKMKAMESRFEEIAKLRTLISQLAQGHTHPRAPRSYKVRSGDSLEKIAREHRVTVESLKQANHLATDKIRVGDPLVIPDLGP